MTILLLWQRCCAKCHIIWTLIRIVDIKRWIGQCCSNVTHLYVRLLLRTLSAVCDALCSRLLWLPARETGRTLDDPWFLSYAICSSQPYQDYCNVLLIMKCWQVINLTSAFKRDYFTIYVSFIFCLVSEMSNVIWTVGKTLMVSYYLSLFPETHCFLACSL